MWFYGFSIWELVGLVMLFTCVHIVIDTSQAYMHTDVTINTVL